jgi:hypothetical protein
MAGTEDYTNAEAFCTVAGGNPGNSFFTAETKSQRRGVA